MLISFQSGFPGPTCEELRGEQSFLPGSRTTREERNCGDEWRRHEEEAVILHNDGGGEFGENDVSRKKYIFFW